MYLSRTVGSRGGKEATRVVRVFTGVVENDNDNDKEDV